MNGKKKALLSLLIISIVASNISFLEISVSAATVDKSETQKYTVSNKKAYVYNPELENDLKVRAVPNLNGDVQGYLYNYDNVEILGTVNTNGTVWDKITYNNNIAYVSDAYVQHYTSPTDGVVNVARI